MENFDMIKISQHAKERYAERIMGRATANEILAYASSNETKIKEDIIKMIQYGEHLYTGKPISELYGRQTVEVYRNGAWVIVVDPKKMTVITVYSVDLGLGTEFNRSYMEKMSQKLTEAKKAFSDVEEEVEKKSAMYRNIISENDAAIADYKKTAKALEDQNNVYRELIVSLQANVAVAEKEVRDIIASMIGRKVF